MKLSILNRRHAKIHRSGTGFKRYDVRVHVRPNPHGFVITIHVQAKGVGSPL